MHKFDTRVFGVKEASAANPGVASEFNIYGGVSMRIQIIGVNFLYLADANAANRHVSLVYDNGTQTFTVAHTPGAIVANETILCNFYLGMPEADYSAADQQMFGPLPDGLFLQSNHPLVSSTTNMQVGDNITTIHFRYKYWFAY